MSNVATPGEPNEPPLTPLDDSPFTFTGTNDETISLSDDDHLVVFFRSTSNLGFEQWAFQVNGSTSYFYRDLSGARVAPDSSIPLVNDNFLMGSRFTVTNHGSDQSGGGFVEVAREGGQAPTMPAVNWFSSDIDGGLSSLRLFNREGTATCDMEVEVYRRP